MMALFTSNSVLGRFEASGGGVKYIGPRDLSESRRRIASEEPKGEDALVKHRRDI